MLMAERTYRLHCLYPHLEEDFDPALDPDVFTEADAGYEETPYFPSHEEAEEEDDYEEMVDEVYWDESYEELELDDDEVSEDLDFDDEDLEDDREYDLEVDDEDVDFV